MPTFHINRTPAFIDAINADKKKELLPALFIGDSWFQYPLRRYRDLEGQISHHFHNQIIGIDDSYPGRDADEISGLSKRWFNLASDLQNIGHPFKFVFLSMGGNDIVGKDFERHLFQTDQSQSPAWPWTPSVPDVCLRRMNLSELSQSFSKVRQAYEILIGLRDRHATGATIITHTYADITPSPKPYKFKGLPLSGPWLHGPLTKAGIHDEDEQREISRWLLESFASLLRNIQHSTIDLVVLESQRELPELSDWWDNEIHPLGNGFKYLAQKYWIPAVRKIIDQPPN